MRLLSELETTFVRACVCGVAGIWGGNSGTDACSFGPRLEACNLAFKLGNVRWSGGEL